MQEVRETQVCETAGRLCEDFTFLRLDIMKEEDESKAQDEEVEELEEEEFSFCSAIAESVSPIAAEDIFEDGRIRPVYPVFNSLSIMSVEEDGRTSGEVVEDKKLPVKKVFVESDPEGPFCEWNGKSHRWPSVVVDATPAACKKSNSTGFSKLLKFRELMVRSHSDGKDAFVFLSPSHNSGQNSTSKSNNSGQNSPSKSNNSGKVANNPKKNRIEAKSKQASRNDGYKLKTETTKGKETTPFSEHYERCRATKEVSKRASYLPYRVGFFADVNGMSRNVHPF